MNPVRWRTPFRGAALLCAVLIAPGDTLYARQGVPAQPQSGSAEANSDARLDPAQIDSLVSPIALYPDPLLAQILAASTYPLQIVSANRWMQQNGKLKRRALVEAAAKQDWEPSIQALVAFSSVVQNLDENLEWTTALGNVFLAQQEDVMASIQRLRQKAREGGLLQSNSQQTVEVKKVEGTQVIVIQPSSPEVIYVPSYNPIYVFGPAPVYAPYPAIVYPPPPLETIVAANAISFGVGVAVGSIFRGCCGSGWGWSCNWGPRPSLYVNNVFVNRYGFRAPPYASHYGTGAWAHNPYYRGAVPYSSATVANRYGVGRAVATPYGSAARVRTPYCSAARTPSGTHMNPKPNAFTGDANRARMSSQQGASSLSGARTGGRRR